VVFGGDFTGAVTQIGTVGEDTLTGTADRDVIFAGAGDDVLDAGGGTDRMSGGAGADTFTIRNLDGTTTIVDFDADEGDVIDLKAFGLADFDAFSAITFAEGPGGQDLRVALDYDTFLILEGVRLDDILTSNVLINS
jgi:Ca2+-binding RTX toxin-like protein